jgi:hypothetical protein
MCSSLGVGLGGSVVIQAIKKLFLVTKIIYTCMIIYFISYWFCLPR